MTTYVIRKNPQRGNVNVDATQGPPTHQSRNPVRDNPKEAPDPAITLCTCMIIYPFKITCVLS